MVKGSNRKSVVIADVARAANVSVPTVSRVLTGAARVGAEKSARVLRAIDELGFRPSPAARALVHGRAELIAVVAGDTSMYGYAATIHGIEIAARAAGHVVIIVALDDPEGDHVKSALDLVLNQSLLGIVVLQFDQAGTTAIDVLPEWIPTVVVSGDRVPQLPQVEIGEESAGFRITEYLLDLGHKAVHHVAVPAGSREKGRTSGWRAALQNRGIAVPPLFQATWEPESGREIGKAIAGRTDITALFCGNDEVALGVIKGLTESGRKVPDEVSVVGFDDHPLSSLWTPGLTTVTQDFNELGQRAVKALFQRIGGAEIELSTSVPPIVIRESAAPPRL